MRFQIILPVFCTLSMLFSCVSQKKYLVEVSERRACLKREQVLQQEKAALEEQLEAYSNRIAYKDGQIESLNREVDRMDYKIVQLQGDLNRIINDATSQQERLELALQARAEDLAQKERLINNLQLRITERDQAMANILNRIEGALAQYTAEELSVELREGKVYVALSDRLLFPSGSYELNERGKEALSRLADAIRRNPDVSILVEGHTDNVPIRTNCIRDNWDLSVLRATSVVSILTAQYGMQPRQFTAGGRGEFQPKATNENQEGRAINRRTEIIIEPRLEKIFGLLRGTTYGD